ncbi:hypothetical protein H2200_003520 [Cladophialophora chaetospira]|uniref:Uncharacterized protein n=1 Tax=Cladophialophora chaetospira TaxID=386627 RepID=A0AA39CMT7_9EURO|nr:hypothetical protein H2200_003520 [Cladophialophora chaetospira]
MATSSTHAGGGSWRRRLGEFTQRRPYSEATKKKLTRVWNRFNDGWDGEITALLFSLACSIAIVVVLLVYDNRPTPKLSKGITLNAIVSVLATASKAALLFTTSSCLGQLKWIWFKGEKARSLSHAQTFDDASRGPLGALELFGSAPRKSVASLGAMLTLLALAYDPFVQQVINIAPEVRYSVSSKVVTEQATKFVAKPSEQRSVQALNAGIYTDRFDRTPICSTGNCTFPRFSSVGWCSTCSQPTDWRFVDGCSLIFKDTDFNDKGGPAPIDLERTCRLTSGSGHFQDITLEAGGGAAPQVEVDYQLMIPTFQITTEFIADPNSQDLRFPWGGRVPMGEWAFTQFKIDDWSLTVDYVDLCTLDLCLRDYDVAIDGSTLHVVTSNDRFGRRYFRSKEFTELTWEQVGNESVDADLLICWEPDGAPKNDSWTLELLEDYSLYASASDFALCMDYISPHWFWTMPIGYAIDTQRATAMGLGGGPGTPGDNRTVHFNNTNMTLYSIRAESPGNGYYPSSYNGSLKFSGTVLLEFNMSGDDNVMSSYSTIQNLGFETVMSNIAAALTAMGIKDPSANDVTGSLGTVETVVHVRWEWLALPAFLVIGATLFLVLTIIVSSRSTTPIWKSSVNALLYHGLEEDLDPHPDLLTVSSMAGMAASASVSLTATKTSPRLVLKNPSSPTCDTVGIVSLENTKGMAKQAVPRATTL